MYTDLKHWISCLNWQAESAREPAGDPGFPATGATQRQAAEAPRLPTAGLSLLCNVCFPAAGAPQGQAAEAPRLPPAGL